MASITQFSSDLPDRRRTNRLNTGITAALIASCLVMTGCGGGDDEARILDAIPNIELQTLDVSAAIPLNATLRDALDHGIPLRFEFVVDQPERARSINVIELRYLPMTKRYEMSSNFGASRSYSSELQLLSALDRVRLPLDFVQTASGSVRVQLDTGSLPAPMRLMALLDSDWHMQSNTASWSTAR